MKINPDALSVDDMIAAMRAGMPRKVGEPTSDAEMAEADAHLQHILDIGGVKFQCIGCGDPIEPADMAQCVCGGFVCPTCRRVEEEGVCTHDRPDFLDADDEES